MFWKPKEESGSGGEPNCDCCTNRSSKIKTDQLICNVWSLVIMSGFSGSISKRQEMREIGNRECIQIFYGKKRERGQELELLGLFFFKDGISKINIKYFLNEVIYFFYL